MLSTGLSRRAAQVVLMDGNVPVETMRFLSTLCAERRRVRSRCPRTGRGVLAPGLASAHCCATCTFSGTQVLAFEPTSIAKCTRALAAGVAVDLATPNRRELFRMAVAVLAEQDYPEAVRVRACHSNIGRASLTADDGVGDLKHSGDSRPR